MFGGTLFGTVKTGRPETAGIVVPTVEYFNTQTMSWKAARHLTVSSSDHSSVLVPRSWFDGHWGKQGCTRLKLMCCFRFSALSGSKSPLHVLGLLSTI